MKNFLILHSNEIALLAIPASAIVIFIIISFVFFSHNKYKIKFYYIFVNGIQDELEKFPNRKYEFNETIYASVYYKLRYRLFYNIKRAIHKIYAQADESVIIRGDMLNVLSENNKLVNDVKYLGYRYIMRSTYPYIEFISYKNIRLTKEQLLNGLDKYGCIDAHNNYDNLNDDDDDDDDVNPATGLPMLYGRFGIDTAGNSYGSDDNEY
ncbi:MAG: hypothetical protein EVG15_10900 [Candidatus Acididesulfobacter diazotrophicus]|jgi:hypothetical protein|uniref:Uncharacterized protein n=1 Tax=Candidatus Acididesulfobacter diazotrophicus TaxID=2597226 RepID=A0A519BJR4_9DELT|nr:MAG: hypothetical protein EVG15_10900 [Candidatus Acididesulfobacter diazotrophicus]